ncbi:unnamed protein product [Adineta ricciae]|uniref:Anion exchange protein n=1 Tax=Adineta ricciae TaxID=249248 RepID=A0A814G221_ADIRI|nr:unnamed protein product [Adineta ricciae]
MQSSKSSTNLESLSYKLNVFLFEHDQTGKDTQCQEYDPDLNESPFDIDDDDDDHFILSDRPLNLRQNSHVKYIQEETSDDLSPPTTAASTETTTTPLLNQRQPDDNHNIGTNSTTAVVPLIVVTDDETDTTPSKRFVHYSSRFVKAKNSYSSITPINMDHLNFKDYFNNSSCPGSPLLAGKVSASSTTNAPNLSAPGVSSSPVAVTITAAGTGTGKRRGFSHRASYKRAHTGRLSIDHTPNELFIELQELETDDHIEYYWNECARWIRYEEDFDVEMLRWQAPRVGCLNYHSLLELRRGLQYGIVLLDLDEQTLDGIYEAIINDAIANGQMNKDAKDEILRILTSNHKHPEPRSSFRRRSSAVDFPPVSTRRSSLAFKKNEQVNTDDSRRMSLLDPKVNGELTKNLKNLVVRYDHIGDSVMTDLQAKQSSSEQLSNTKGSDESVNQLRPANISHRPSQSQPKRSRDSGQPRSDLMRRIPDDAECAEVLIGGVKILTRPVMAFVRLSEGQHMVSMTEVPLPVKFIFVLIGPVLEEYFEIGRSLSTLFSTPDFRAVAYQAMDRRDLLGGINDFLTDTIVLPPGDFDKELLLPVIETAKMKNNNAKRRSTRRRKQTKGRSTDGQQQQSSSQASRVLLAQISSLSHEKQEDDPFLRSGFVFGGVYREMQRRYAYFKSDFLDAYSLHCLVSLVFMFIACLAPALTFGGIIADKTNNLLGVNEMMIASSMNGFIFGLFSGQPLMILGPTGPFLVFEEMVYDLCQLLNSDFWTVRCCVSLWTTFFIIILVAFEGSFMIRHVTRFTEEIFALIIALVYLYEPFKKLYKIFRSNPVQSIYNYDYPLTCVCNLSSIVNITLDYDTVNSSSNDMLLSTPSKYSCYNCISAKQSSSSSLFVSNNNSTSMPSDDSPLPNKALLSFIILIGTCFISVALKRFRRSNFFGRTTRQTLSDFGMTIALIFMVLFDMLVTKSAGGHSLTQKITVPDSIRPSDRERGDTWFISPTQKSLPFWLYFASSFPAILISVVLFFEVELTSIMIQSKLRCVQSSKVVKGTGYHLDILIAGILVSVSGLFGLPWMCAAPVRSIAHVASLSKYSNTHAPGEKARLIEIKDQRLTNIGVHLFIGCTIFAAPIIRKIPVAALFGIFLYFGIVSISGTQLFSRLKMTFIPTKYHPNFGYLRRVRQMKRNTYTFIQLMAAALLITIKITRFAFLFPFILVLLVPFRKWCLPFFFTERELNELDGDEEQDRFFDDELDFYGQVHLPI